MLERERVTIDHLQEIGVGLSDGIDFQLDPPTCFGSTGGRSWGSPIDFPSDPRTSSTNVLLVLCLSTTIYNFCIYSFVRHEQMQQFPKSEYRHSLSKLRRFQKLWKRMPSYSDVVDSSKPESKTSPRPHIPRLPS